MPPRPTPPPLLRSPLLESVPWLRHGFSTRQDGRGGDNFDLATSVRSRQRFARAVAGEAWPLLALRQIHGDLVWRDPEPDQAGDAMLSRHPERLLSIRTADCCPILLVDVRHRAIAAIHAGWRGTLARVATKAVGEMRAAFDSQPDDLRAAIGPSIRACCYEVGEEIHAAFCARFDYGDQLFQDAEDDPVRNRYPMLFMTGAPPGHPYDPRWNQQQPRRLDLAAANQRQLLAAGLAPEAVDVLPYCTACRRDLFFSHRRGDSGRMLAAIGLRPVTKK